MNVFFSILLIFISSYVYAEDSISDEPFTKNLSQVETENNWGLSVGAVYIYNELYFDRPGGSQDFIVDQLTWTLALHGKRQYFSNSRFGYRHSFTLNSYQLDKERIREPGHYSNYQDVDIGTSIDAIIFMYHPEIFYSIVKRDDFSFLVGLGYGIGYMGLTGEILNNQSDCSLVELTSGTCPDLNNPTKVDINDFAGVSGVSIEAAWKSVQIKLSVQGVGNNVLLGLVDESDDADSLSPNFIHNKIEITYLF